MDFEEIQKVENMFKKEKQNIHIKLNAKEDIYKLAVYDWCLQSILIIKNKRADSTTITRMIDIYMMNVLDKSSANPFAASMKKIARQLINKKESLNGRKNVLDSFLMRKFTENELDEQIKIIQNSAVIIPSQEQALLNLKKEIQQNLSQGYK